MRAMHVIAGSVVAALTLTLGVAGAEDAKKADGDGEAKLKVGEKAPDFEMPKPGEPEGSKETIKLSDLKGQKNVVLAFYPKAFTSGCTKQLCGYRDDISKYESADTQIVAISTDKQADSDTFKKEKEMPFVVLGDEKHEVVDAYGIPMKDYGGNQYAQRSIVLIDKEGIVRYIDMEYDIENDEAPLLEAIAKLEESKPEEKKQS